MAPHPAYLRHPAGPRGLHARRIPARHDTAVLRLARRPARPRRLPGREPGGRGAERPGRRESAPPDEAAYEEAAPVPEPTSVPDEPGDPAARPGTVSGPVLRILPLGSGLVLIGLGLGLAFLALRLRVRRT